MEKELQAIIVWLAFYSDKTWCDLNSVTYHLSLERSECVLSLENIIMFRPCSSHFLWAFKYTTPPLNGGVSRLIWFPSSLWHWFDYNDPSYLIWKLWECTFMYFYFFPHSMFHSFYWPWNKPCSHWRWFSKAIVNTNITFYFTTMTQCYHLRATSLFCREKKRKSV